METPIHSLELWSDSFHEGHWACSELAKHLPMERVRFLYGFVPQYLFSLPNGDGLEVTVFGSYHVWSPLPIRIAQLLEWGKPDLIAYVPDEDRILFAVEETAAVPTGNQALQRFERIYGSARMGIPFWYLVGEYGMHLDQNVRRDSIWAAVGCLKLTAIFGVPSVLLHYSQRDAPEDYSAGTGLHSLFQILSRWILGSLRMLPAEDLLVALTRQYSEMCEFIRSHWLETTDYLPSVEEIAGGETARGLAARALGADLGVQLEGLLDWGRSKDLSQLARARQGSTDLIKHDSLMAKVEELVRAKVAYTLSGRAGSRPQPVDRVVQWIREQAASFDTEGLERPPEFNMRIEDFPRSATGLLHVTTGRNVAYLVDRWADLADAISVAYPRLSMVRQMFTPGDPAFMYVSNSLRPGRIFGDPFTGQLTCFTVLFARDTHGEPSRLVIAYYPHQAHSQLFDSHGVPRRNKGITLMTELVDLAIFHGGIAVGLRGLHAGPNVI